MDACMTGKVPKYMNVHTDMERDNKGLMSVGMGSDGCRGMY